MKEKIAVLETVRRFFCEQFTEANPDVFITQANRWRGKEKPSNPYLVSCTRRFSTTDGNH